MSSLRELTDAELDLVSGGAQAVYKIAEPTSCCEPRCESRCEPKCDPCGGLKVLVPDLKRL
jgi:hypothetical protein